MELRCYIPEYKRIGDTMKTLLIFLLLSTLSLASQKIYNAKHVSQVNNTLYDKRTQKPIDGVIEAYFPSGKL